MSVITGSRQEDRKIDRQTERVTTVEPLNEDIAFCPCREVFLWFVLCWEVYERFHCAVL